MNRDETKRAAEEALRGDAYGATDRELWLDIERRKYARAFLAQCEREEKVLEALKNCVQWMIEHGCSHEYAVLIDAKAAIKAIEEGR
jgi:hypothetical protein